MKGDEYNYYMDETKSFIYKIHIDKIKENYRGYVKIIIPSIKDPYATNYINLMSMTMNLDEALFFDRIKVIPAEINKYDFCYTINSRGTSMDVYKDGEIIQSVNDIELIECIMQPNIYLQPDPPYGSSLWGPGMPIEGFTVDLVVDGII